MAINPALLIAAPVLQDSFIDNVTNTAMSGGIITCYQDTSRTTLKNWYYQVGAPGTPGYTYIPLPNPLTLSGAGTIVDVNGVDVIPFFYPYDETDNQTLQPYYITVYDSNGQLQFTRSNFPYKPQVTSVVETSTLENLVINNQFWRNIGSINAGTLSNTIFINNSTSYKYATLAPSNHDGFNLPDITYIKDQNGGSETITFTAFGQGNDPFLPQVTPEYYIEHDCTAFQPGQQFKIYQFPIQLHVKTLESINYTVTIRAKLGVGSGAANIQFYIYQFLGTGATSLAPIPIGNPLVLTNDWNTYIISGQIFPSSQGLTLGKGGDDALFLWIGMPATSDFIIDFAIPSLYLGNILPTNDFSTYDQIDSIINSPRTSDIKTSFSSYQPSGYILMNDTSIGDSTSGATRANIDTWPLYSYLYTNVSDTYAPVSGGRTAPGNTLGAAYTDWTANKTLTMPLILGRALASSGHGSGLTSRAVGENTGAETETLIQNQLPTTVGQAPGSDSPASQTAPYNSFSGSPNAVAINGYVPVTNPGGGQPLSIMQPTTFMNVFIKL